YVTKHPDILVQAKSQIIYDDLFRTVESVYNNLMLLKEKEESNGNGKIKSNFFLTEPLVLKEISNTKMSSKDKLDVNVVINSLMEKTKLPRDRVESFLIQLHMNNKIFLHPDAISKNNSPLIVNGEKFYSIS
ncbi:MAG: hypothetical protein ACFFD1_07730, partial [Candidatus Thorarchaeota archaeon]